MITIKKITMVLLLFVATNVTAQQLYLEGVKSSTTFDFKSSRGVKLDNLQATAHSFMAIEALKERQSLTELATQFEIHPNQTSKWKREFLDNADWAFDGVDSGDTEPSVNVDSLYSQNFKREEHFFVSYTPQV